MATNSHSEHLTKRTSHWLRRKAEMGALIGHPREPPPKGAAGIRLPDSGRCNIPAGAIPASQWFF